MTSTPHSSSSGDQPVLPAGVFKDTATVEGLLARIGLSADDLEDAAWAGIREYLECTLHDLPHMRGSLLSGKALRELRDILVERDWISRTVRGHGTVVHPLGLVAITTAVGDHNTGLVQATPSTSATKGVETETLIQGIQLPLFGPTPRFADTPIGCVLLIHAFDEERRVNLELSAPQRIDEDQLVSTWRTRLILRSIPYDGGIRQPVASPATAPQQPVEVQRKSA